MDPYADHVRSLQRAAHGLVKIKPVDGPATTRVIRRSRRPRDGKMIRLQLVEVDGLLDWREAVAPAISRPARRRGQTTRLGAGRLVAEGEFPNLAPNEVTSFLVHWDDRCTPHRGLRKWNPTRHQLDKKSAVPPKSRRALVIVHGTFSNGDTIFDALHAAQDSQGNPVGADFLDAAVKKYNGQVYAFDHPTLSVGPILNAVDLAAALGGSKASIDIISHSRGGLVTSWFDFLYRGDPGLRRAVLVGSPLAGTSLASPANIRNTLRLLQNVTFAAEKVVGLATAAAPVLAVVQAMLTIVHSAARWTAGTPLVDALVSMVPGLFAQSRVGNNPELLRLMETQFERPARYYFVKSNFEPTDPGWAFWRRFRKSNIADFAADLIFDGTNDLVVDTDSMDALVAASRGNRRLNIPASQIRDFQTSAIVHHLNYFQQTETIEFLRKSLF